MALRWVYDTQRPFGLIRVRGKWVNSSLSMSDESSCSESSFGTPFRALVDHCLATKLNFQSDPAQKTVLFFIVGEYSLYNVIMRITRDDSVVQVLVRFPVFASDAKIRPLAAEMVTRANHGLLLGNLDIDMDDGEVRYQVGQVIPESGLDDKLLGSIVSTALGTADVYFTALMRVMFGGHTPSDAVYLAELSNHSEAVEASPPAAKKPSSSTPGALKTPPRRKKRRNRQSRRSSPTRELPGLFSKPSEVEPPKGDAPATNPDPPAREE